MCTFSEVGHVRSHSHALRKGKDLYTSSVYHY